MVAFQHPAQFRDFVYGFQTSRIFLTAFELDLFTLLDPVPLGSAETAAAAGADARACDRLMNALVALGLLAKEDSRFRNSDFASQYLVKGKPGYLASYGHTLNMWQTWSHLTEAVVSGTRAPGKRANNREWTTKFIAAMHDRAYAQADAVVNNIDLTGVGRLLDVGGGSGVYSMAFIRKKNDLKATVFDLPAVITETKKYVRAAGMQKNFAFMKGNYHTDDLGSGYDLIFLSAIVHINSTEENLKLIRKCAGALNPGGQLIIQDHIMDEDRTSPEAGAFFALNMLVATDHGDTYTEKEMRAWYENAGISHIQRIPTFKNALLIGRKR